MSLFWWVDTTSCPDGNGRSADVSWAAERWLAPDAPMGPTLDTQEGTFPRAQRGPTDGSTRTLQTPRRQVLDVPQASPAIDGLEVPDATDAANAPSSSMAGPETDRLT